MGKLALSWAIIKNSFSVLMANKKLLLFPILTTSFILFIAFFFFSGFVLQPTGHGYGEAAHWQAVAGKVFTDNSLNWVGNSGQHAEVRLKPEAVALISFFYLLSMFLATFFNAAFYHEIMNGLRGQEVSIREGFGFAISKLQAILLWSLLAGLVGLVIKYLEEKVGLIGKLMLRVIGLAWSIASIFAIPVLVETEDTNPVEILKRSALTLKKTWGEALIGFMGIGMGTSLVFFLSFLLFAGGILLSVTAKSIPILVITVVLWIGLLTPYLYVINVLEQIYCCALYLYASTGTVPSPYQKEQMDLPWRRKSP